MTPPAAMSRPIAMLDDADPVVSPISWERQMGAVRGAIGQTAPRVVLVGTAGAGKSSGLQRLYELFRSQSRDARMLHDDPTTVADAPAQQILLVDDAHLLSDAQLQHLGERARDPEASLIIAQRPWPARPALRAITARLEQHAPAIVLGHVTRADIIDHLDARGRRLPETCIEHIVQTTRGVAWLAAAAVQHHDSRDCAHDRNHESLDDSVAELIIHRLDMIDERLRERIEEVCIAAPGTVHSADGEPDDWALRGYAHGLLVRSGEAAPIVRTAVRRAMPTRRLIDLCIRHPESLRDPDGLPALRDARVAEALVSTADRMLRTDPRRASALYTAALRCGAPELPLAARRAAAAWSNGDLDEASTAVEDAIACSADDVPAEVSAVAAATWSARAMMREAHRVHQAIPPADQVTLANAAVAALGVGEADPSSSSTPAPLPTAIAVSATMLRRGLRATTAPDAMESSLADLVRSAEMYTRTGRSDALCELPAVVAAVVALNLGRLVTAQSVLDEAVEGGHGGPWAQTRLLLWSAWVAVQRAHPAEARELLRRVETTGIARLSTRDALLLQAVRVAIARRYEDASGLDAAWQRARAVLLRADIDLYLLHPVAELITAGTRAGDADRVEPQVRTALQMVEALGSPPLWTAHLHWAVIQQGILLSRPDRLTPHAKALVAAAPHSRVAAGMAKAGRVWTDVLAGSVAADAVMAAAEGLAAVGLMWDAARLAGHGAARTPDRRIAAQLLACARELHPTDGTRRPEPTAGGDAEAVDRTAAEEVLSDREIEVARLVLQGKTYAEIGESIFISPRTAEHHIAHIRRRLGATSRSEMLARLRVLLGENDARAGHTTEPP
ncbi:LuxR C-terminal-related transcriptional regulator [Microbacterium sp. OR16]|uniref:LuxR C-terminal-related transcriptional regulator n=1 Tax=Microbacterium sp. OR16 TaxID=3095345 RepID=UPI0039B45BB8